MSLKKKLTVLCLVLIFFTVIVGGISYWGILKLDSGLNKISKISLPKIQYADNLYIHFAQTRIALRTLGLSNLSTEIANKAIETVMSEIDEYEEYNKKYTRLNFLPGEEEIYKEVNQDWNELKNIGVKVLGLYKTGKTEDRETILNIFINDCAVAAEKYNESIKKLVGFHEKNVNEWNKEAFDDSKLVKEFQLGIIIVGTILGLFIGYLFSKHIAFLITKISKDISKGSDQIEKYTGEISIVSHSLLDNISKQALSLQQTTAAIEQTKVSITNNSENVKKSFEISNLGQKNAREGKNSMNETLLAMEKILISINEIKSEMDLNNKEIGGIVEIINEIGAKTKVINEIVFQTKLLSFNASVEAARAGEHGKGFAVVAEEVGNLAAMSGKSAQEIAHLLENSIKKVEITIENSKKRVSSLIEQSNHVVTTGNMTIKKCDHNLDDIISNINHLNELIGEISKATHEQTSSMNEINKAMGTIDATSFANSSSSEQTSQTVSLLEHQLLDFRKIIVKLNRIVEGKAAS